MSSNGLFSDESLDLEQTRRSTRERRQPQYFGYSGSDGQAEVHNGIAVTQVTGRGKERSTMTPSLIVKLPSPRFAPHESLQFPPCREVQIPHINAEKKRGFGSLTDDEQGVDKSSPVFVEEPTKKRQRLSPTMPQSTQEAEGHPKPRGQPEVWAEVNHIQQVTTQTLANASLGPASIMRVAALLSIISLGCVCLGQLKWVCGVRLQLPSRQRQ